MGKTGPEHPELEHGYSSAWSKFSARAFHQISWNIRLPKQQYLFPILFNIVSMMSWVIHVISRPGAKISCCCRRRLDFNFRCCSPHTLTPSHPLFCFLVHCILLPLGHHARIESPARARLRILSTPHHHRHEAIRPQPTSSRVPPLASSRAVLHFASPTPRAEKSGRLGEGLRGPRGGGGGRAVR